MARSSEPPEPVAQVHDGGGGGSHTSRPGRDAGSESDRPGPDTEQCPECDGRLNDDPKRGETVCADCGLVVKENEIDRGPEWRSFEDSGDGHFISRCGGSANTPTYHDNGLGSRIGRTRERESHQQNRMRTWNARAQFERKTDRNRATAFGEIKRVTAALDLSSHICSRACVLFKQAQDANVIQGRSLEAFAGGAIYAATRERALGRLPEDTGEVSQLDEESLGGGSTPADAITNAYSVLCREFNIKPKPPSPADYIPRATSDLGLSRETKALATTLARLAEDEHKFIGRAPSGTAGGCIYLAAQATGEHVTQTETADVLNVEPVTVRTNRDELRELDAVDAEGGITTPEDLTPTPSNDQDDDVEAPRSGDAGESWALAASAHGDAQEDLGTFDAGGEAERPPSGTGRGTDGGEPSPSDVRDPTTAEDERTQSILNEYVEPETIVEVAPSSPVEDEETSPSFS